MAQSRDQNGRACDAGLLQQRLLGRVADQMKETVSFDVENPLGILLDDHERPVGASQAFADKSPDPAVSGDDRVLR